MLRYVGIIFLVELSKYRESFIMIMISDQAYIIYDINSLAFGFF